MTLKELFTSIANAIREKKGTTNTIKAENFADEISTIETGGGSQYTGHVDKEGLRKIGWTEEDINWLQENVFWNEEDDNIYKLNQEDIVTTIDNSVRFLPKISNIFVDNFSYRLLTIPKFEITRTDMSSMFSSCYSLKKIPKLNTQNVTNMRNMFSGCSSLIEIPELDTQKVTDMSSMFSSCYSLKKIPKLNTQNVTNMHSMLNSCSSLIEIPKLDTQKVTDIGYMFSGCSSLIEIPELDTQKVTDMSSMFNSCYSLTKIPKLNMSKVNKTSYMFNKCYNLASIDLSNIDFNTVTSFSNMLSNCGYYCKKRYGAYANGIPYVYVKDEEAQNWVLTANNGHPTTWSTANVIVAGSEQDTRERSE